MAKSYGHDVDPVTGKVHFFGLGKGHPEEVATFKENQIGQGLKALAKKIVKK